MSEASRIEVVGRLRRDDGEWDDGVSLGVFDFSGWGENQVVSGHAERTWEPGRYAVLGDDGDVLMRGEMVEIGGVLTTGDVLAPERPLEPGEPWHFIVPRPVQ